LIASGTATTRSCGFSRCAIVAFVQ